MGRDDPKPTTTRKDWGAVSPVLNHWKKQKNKKSALHSLTFLKYLTSVTCYKLTYLQT